MSSDGSSDWIGPLLLFNALGIVALVAIGVNAWRLHVETLGCNARHGVLVETPDGRLCISRAAILPARATQEPSR